MTDKLTITCDHLQECETKEEYVCYAQYVELWTVDGLKQIIPSDDEPVLECANCGAPARTEKIEPKKQRKQKIETMRLL